MTAKEAPNIPIKLTGDFSIITDANIITTRLIVLPTASTRCDIRLSETK